ncbi:MAG: SDR family oxidoreductase [Desulfobacterales bacterium]|jgi:NAD(P)-dependent dehydrogenase (short-subunit alcohol dehydrogenase family)
MEHRIILVTGSTDGIGKRTALELAALGHHIIVHGKSQERCEESMATIADATGRDRLDSIVGDLASIRAIHTMADALKDRFPRIDVLVNNAGVFQKYRRLTEDGFETTLQVNHLAPFLLTGLLLDSLLKSPAGRIVTLSSVVHAQSLDLERFTGAKTYDGFETYSQSKLCNILFTVSLAARLKATSITANCLHPGVINTKLLRQHWHGGSPVSEGYKTSVFLACSPEVDDVTGRYFVNRKPATPARIVQDVRVQEALWSKTVEWTGMVYPY